MTPTLVKVSKLKKNPDNPRIIKDDKFEKLVKSIKDFPKMLEIRPIVYTSDFVVLGGNMRLEAAKAAGLSEVWAVDASELTQEQQKEFIIKDNVGYGEWDWGELTNNWDANDLEDLGLDVPGFDSSEIDYSGKNQEIDTDDFSDKMTIKLNYIESDYNIVRDQLSKIAATPEQAVWKLLGNE